jgi:hypothetical protein
VASRPPALLVRVALEPAETPLQAPFTAQLICSSTTPRSLITGLWLARERAAPVQVDVVAMPALVAMVEMPKAELQ